MMEGKVTVERIEENKYVFTSNMWEELTAYELMEKLHVLQSGIADSETRIIQTEEAIAKMREGIGRYQKSIDAIKQFEEVAMEEAKKHQESFLKETIEEIGTDDNKD